MEFTLSKEEELGRKLGNLKGFVLWVAGFTGRYDPISREQLILEKRRAYEAACNQYEKSLQEEREEIPFQQWAAKHEDLESFLGRLLDTYEPYHDFRWVVSHKMFPRLGKMYYWVEVIPLAPRVDGKPKSPEKLFIEVFSLDPDELVPNYGNHSKYFDLGKRIEKILTESGWVNLKRDWEERMRYKLNLPGDGLYDRYC